MGDAAHILEFLPPGVTPKSSFDAAEEEEAPVGWLVAAAAAAAATCRLQKADEWLLEGVTPPPPPPLCQHPSQRQNQINWMTDLRRGGAGGWMGGWVFSR